MNSDVFAKLGMLTEVELSENQCIDKVFYGDGTDYATMAKAIDESCAFSEYDYEYEDKDESLTTETEENATTETSTTTEESATEQYIKATDLTSLFKKFGEGVRN